MKLSLDDKQKKIRENPVGKGDEFKSFAELCRHFGLPSVKGKQRSCMKLLFECYFSYTEVAPDSNKIVITDTFFDAPRSYMPTHKGVRTTATNKLMQELILAMPWEIGKLYTKSEMLRQLHLITSYYGENKEETQVETNYIKTVFRTFDSAIKQLIIKEQNGTQNTVQVTQVTGCRDSNKEITYECSAEEEAAYNALVCEVLHEMGYRTRVDVRRAKKLNLFYNKLNAQVREIMKLDDEVYQGYAFSKAASPEGYTESRSESNALCILIATRQYQRHKKHYDNECTSVQNGARTHRLLPPDDYKAQLNDVLKRISPSLEI